MMDGIPVDPGVFGAAEGKKRQQIRPSQAEDNHPFPVLSCPPFSRIAVKGKDGGRRRRRAGLTP
ncbi:Hypothetical protein GbCGDNIH3_1616 [Granulibacter bethesdensis]|uniref:Uncharacterized protein n=1 Tax=Granulibacter bethesdensis TaxID=364410 RepID=A0AAN1G3T0_9PROT|nr:Hypothetical protein GbCGDNIH3_1616 [Granulibacter bethesdensis]